MVGFHRLLLNVELSLLVAGLVITGGCFLSLIFGWLPALPEKVQKFKGLGVELQVSVLSLLFLIGVGLCVPAAYFRFVNLEKKLDEVCKEGEKVRKDLTNQVSMLTGQIQALGGELVRSKQLSVRIRVKLESLSQANVRDLQCLYRRIDRPAQPVEAPIVTGQQDGEIEIILEGIERDSGLLELSIINRLNHEKWSLSSQVYYPLYPLLVLNRAK